MAQVESTVPVQALTVGGETLTGDETRVVRAPWDGAPIAASGATAAGFSTVPQPAATAGPTLCAARLSGKLKGVIAATTPIGTRIV